MEKEAITKKQINELIETLYPILKDNESKYAFGGSFSLKLNGLLDRPMYDVDLTIDDIFYMDVFKPFVDKIKNEFDDLTEITEKDNTESINDIPEDIKRKLSIKINDLNICLFITSVQRMKMKFKFNEKYSISLLTPFQILTYKQYYVDKAPNAPSSKKHYEDIGYVLEKMIKRYNILSNNDDEMF